MKIDIHRSEHRGEADYGWLKAKYSFSFAQYYQPNRIHFGVLRVLNDDSIAPGRGFGTHPHDNMEIVTIPLQGELTHQDSMGHKEVIRSGEVQVMSAGTGVEHSEFNEHAEASCQLFQIWFLPKVRNVKPRYDQAAYDVASLPNGWVTLVHPQGQGDGLWIHQDVWIHMTELQPGQSILKQSNVSGYGHYIMVIDGSISIDEHTLYRRDEAQIRDTDSFEMTALETARILAIEVPLSLPRIR